MGFVGDLSIAHLLILVAILLLLFGAKRIPEIGRSLGQGIREFTNSLTELGRPPENGTRDQHQEKSTTDDRELLGQEIQTRRGPKRLQE
jgi:sec-independent protein translocase protein TatA